MRRDELKLVFETERRILERRLKRLFPGLLRKRVEPAAHGGGSRIAPHGARAVKPAGAASERARSAGAAPVEPDRSVVIAPPSGAQELMPFVLSLAVHILLIAAILPNVKGEAQVEERTHIVSLRLSAPARHPRAIAAKEAAPGPEAKAAEPEAPAVEPPPAEVVPAPAEPAAPDSSTIENALEEEPLLASPADPLGIGAGRAGAPGTVDGRGDSPFGSRLGGKAGALRRFGGAGTTEAAVSEGLAWLARHQDPNGSWDPAGYQRHCHGGAPCRGAGFAEFRVGVTALALLAFLGAGIDDVREHPHRDAVRKGLEFLRMSQEDDGCFGREGKKYMYNHAIATFCMAEAYHFCRNARYRESAERGLEYSAATQQPGGGWDYTSAQSLRNDLSVTGWQIMAMQAARDAEIPISQEMERRARGYLMEAVHPGGASTYADRGTGAGRQGISIAAVGLLSKLYLGWSPRSSELKRAADRIILQPPDHEKRIAWERYYQSSYYWYYATLALFHMGGERWEAWNTLLQREVLPLQHGEGERRGSFDADPNWLGAEGGRVASTAFLVLTFEVYYRYKPLHEKLGIPPDSTQPPAARRP